MFQPEEAHRLFVRLAHPLVRSQKGLVALYTGARLKPGIELVMDSVWEDEESVAGFAGPQWHSPVVLAGEEELVLQTEVANYQSW